MKRKLSLQKGFTMAEVLIVVALIGIVSAFGFLAVQNYKKNMTNLEMQSAAKEIYLASQEHLTLAKSEKLLDDVSSGTSGFTAATTETRYKTAYHLGLQESDSYYVVTSEDKDQTNSVLNLLLPSGSIEDYVRGNYYAIRYSTKSYQVTDVFYSDNEAFGDYLNSSDFKSSDNKVVATGWNNLINNYKTGPNDLDGASIGYYGAEEYYMEMAEETGAPVVKVNNAEKLTVTITLPYTSDKYEGNILLHVAQANDESRYADIEIPATYFNNSDKEYTYVLDDITDESKQFHNAVVLKQTNTDKQIIIGSDISITATAVVIGGYTTTTNGTTTTTSKNATVTGNTVYTNSLFSDNTLINDDAGTMTAHISNFRHLENLGTNISGFAYDAKIYKEATTAQSNGFTAVMDKSLDWSKASGEGTEFKNYAYKPINPTYQLYFNGNNKRISNLSIETTDAPAGVFGTINMAGGIKALDIYNITVKGTAGGETAASAGALIGEVNLNGAAFTVEGVVARQSTGKGADETSQQIEATGGADAGGLIGTSTAYSEGKLIVTQSAAAVYVKSANGAAGGLIGRIVGNAEISESYAGGHTIGGDYKDSDAGQGRYNVYAASGMAGGLIGAVAKYTNGGGQVNISTAYATTSVKGMTAGNFIGASSGVTLASGTTNYAIGTVFVADGQNAYMIDGLADAAELALALANQTYHGTEKARMADPYDSELTKSDGANRMYIYPNMYQLTKRSTAYPYRFLNFHVGDWVAVDKEEPADDTKVWTVQLVEADPGADYSYDKLKKEGDELVKHTNPSVLSTQLVMDGNSAILPMESNVEAWRWWTKDEDNTWKEPTGLVYKYDSNNGGWGVYQLTVDKETKERTYALASRTIGETYPGAVHSDLLVTPIYNDNWSVTIAYVDENGTPITNSQPLQMTVLGGQNTINVTKKEFGGYTFDGYYTVATDGTKIGEADATTLNLVSTEVGNAYDIKSTTQTIYARYKAIGTYTVKVNYWLNSTLDLTNVYTKTTTDTDLTVPISYAKRGDNYIARRLVEYNGDTPVYEADSQAEAETEKKNNWSGLDTDNATSYTYKKAEETVINLYFTTAEAKNYKVTHVFSNSDSSTVEADVFDPIGRTLKVTGAISYRNGEAYSITESYVSAEEGIAAEKLALASYDGFHVSTDTTKTKIGNEGEATDGTKYTEVTITYERNKVPLYFELQAENTDQKYATWKDDGTRTLSRAHDEMFIIEQGMTYQNALDAELMSSLPNNNTAGKPQMMSDGYNFKGFDIYSYANGIKGAALTSSDVITDAVLAVPKWEEKDLPTITVEIWRMKVDADTNDEYKTDYTNNTKAYDFYRSFDVDTSDKSGGVNFGTELTGHTMANEADLPNKLITYVINTERMKQGNTTESDYNGVEEVDGTTYKRPKFYHFTYNAALTQSYNEGLGTIQSDGSTVVRLYYKRDEVTINFYDENTYLTGYVYGNTDLNIILTNTESNSSKNQIRITDLKLTDTINNLINNGNAIIVSASQPYIKIKTDCIGITKIYSNKKTYTGEYVYCKIPTGTTAENIIFDSSKGFGKRGELDHSWKGLYNNLFENYGLEWTGAWARPNGDMTQLHTYFGFIDIKDTDTNEENMVKGSANGSYSVYFMIENDEARLAYETAKNNDDKTKYTKKNSHSKSKLAFTIVKKYEGYEPAYYSLSENTGTTEQTKMNPATEGTTVTNNNLWIYHKRSAFTIFLKNYQLTDAQVKAITDKGGVVDKSQNSIKCLYQGNVYEVLKVLEEKDAPGTRPNTIDTDYELAYWSLDAGGKQKVDSDNPYAMPANDIMVFAHWKAPTKMVTFTDTTGRDTESTETKTVAKGSAVGAISDPTPTDASYKFLGWYNDKNMLEPFDPAITPIETNRTVYAGWVATTEVIFEIECVDSETNLPFYRETKIQSVNVDGNSVTIEAPTVISDNGTIVNPTLYTRSDVSSRFTRKKIPSNYVISNLSTLGGTKKTLTFLYSIGSIGHISYEVQNYLRVDDENIPLGTAQTNEANLTTDIYTPENIEGLQIVEAHLADGSGLSTAIEVQNNSKVEVYYELETSRLSVVPKSGNYNGLEYEASISGIPTKLSDLMAGDNPSVQAVYTYAKYKSGNSGDTEDISGVPKDAGTYEITAKLQIKNNLGNWKDLWTGTGSETIAKRTVQLTATQKDAETGLDVSALFADEPETNSLEVSVGTEDTDIIVTVPTATNIPADQDAFDAVTSWTDDEGRGILAADSNKLTLTTPITLTKKQVKDAFAEDATEGSVTVEVKGTISDATAAANYQIVNYNVTLKLKKTE